MMTIVIYVTFLFYCALTTASPNSITFQSRIVKPDGFTLEAAAVNFRISISDTVGSCIIFQEDFTNRDMTGSKGLINLTVGNGTKMFPLGPMTMADVFNNINSPTFNCLSGGSINAGATDRRKLILQFNDGSGWQTVPAMDINSNPFALQAMSAQRLGDFPASDYLRVASFPTCNPGEALHFNGTSFTCVTAGSGIANGGNTGATTIGTNDSSALNFETNNTTRMSIDTTGQVSIGGPIVPAGTLHTLTGGVRTSSAISNYIENTTTSSTGSINKVGMEIQSTGIWNGALANNIGLSVNVSGGTNNYAAIFLGGNVGIGTSSPQHPLHVAGKTAQIGDGSFEMDATDNDLQVGISNDIGASNGSVVFGRSNFSRYDNSVTFGTANTINTPGAFNSMAIGHTNTVTVGGAVAIGKNVTNSVTNSLMIGPNDSAKLTILSTGNVGVGTTTPAAKVDIAGEVKISESGLACSGSTKGAMRYNDGLSVLEFCNGTSWTLLQASACSDPAPAVFTFTNEANAILSTLTTSNIIQVTGINCQVPVTVSGNGSPQFQICNDAGCGSIVQGWTTSPSTISNNQYLQMRLTADSVGGSPYQGTIIVGSGATVWTVTTAGGDCVGTTPAVGTVCADGTIYAGLSPDGNVKMFTTRCDVGQAWDGFNCTGTRMSLSWNNGTGGAGYVPHALTSGLTGKANSAAIAGWADGGSPYAAAQYCESLNQNTQTDWYLPATSELNLLYSGRHAIKNFDLSGSYWTSTEESDVTAYIIYFPNGMVDGAYYGYGYKSANRFFRCVRRQNKIMRSLKN